MHTPATVHTLRLNEGNSAVSTYTTSHLTKEQQAGWGLLSSAQRKTETLGDCC